MGLGFLLALWLVVLFVLPDVNSIRQWCVSVVGWIAAVVLLVFNTGSIFNMVRHYGHDKERIYAPTSATSTLESKRPWQSKSISPRARALSGQWIDVIVLLV
jgi:hypothetical protein